MMNISGERRKTMTFILTYLKQEGNIQDKNYVDNSLWPMVLS